MTNWYREIETDLSKILEFTNYYESELIEARIELTLSGKSIETHASELPGIVELRFRQLQEIEAVLEYLNIKLRKDRAAQFKNFLEKYQKSLTSRDAEKYVDGVDAIVESTLLVNEVALLRNKFLAISKGTEAKNFMIGYISKLKIAGIEDATV